MPEAADNVVPLTKTGARCPQCKRPAVQQHRPFCSVRCANVDLGAWLTESYTIGSTTQHGDEDD